MPEKHESENWESQEFGMRQLYKAKIVVCLYPLSLVSETRLKG